MAAAATLPLARFGGRTVSQSAAEDGTAARVLEGFEGSAVLHCRPRPHAWYPCAYPVLTYNAVQAILYVTAIANRVPPTGRNSRRTAAARK